MRDNEGKEMAELENMKTYEEQYPCCNNNALALTASKLFLPLVFILHTAGSRQTKHTHAL